MIRFFDLTQEIKIRKNEVKIRVCSNMLNYIFEKYMKKLQQY